MYVLDIIGFAAIAATCLGFILVGLTPGLVSRTSRGWIDKIGAPVDPQTRLFVQETRGRRLAVAMAMAFVGLVIGVAVGYLVVGRDSSLYYGVVVVGFVVGMWSGQGLRAFAVALATGSSDVRSAHASAMRLDDYVRPRVQVVVRIEVVLLTTVCGALALLPGSGGAGFGAGSAGPLWMAAGLISLSALSAEVIARRVVNRPLPGATPMSIVWHDALRRELVMDLYLTPTLVAPLCLLTVQLWLTSSGSIASTYPFLVWLVVIYLLASFVPALVQLLNEKAAPAPTQLAT